VRVLDVPAELEERTFDGLVRALGGQGDRVLVDASPLRWVDPYGMLGVLAVGEAAARRGAQPRLRLPASAEVTSYLRRMGFFQQAERIFELHGSPGRGAGAESDVLLEITPIRSHADVHAVVDRVHERASRILRSQLGYPLSESVQFSVVLSEVCQNIIEHAQSDGWVAAQTYTWKRRLGRRVAVIAVMDLGIGFERSLASAHAARFGERWSDATALESVLLQGLTRFADPGRGQGIQQIRRQVGRWGGKFSIRSGKARVAQVPPWDDSPELESPIPPFPGTQICLVLPARERMDAAAAMSPGNGSIVSIRFDLSELVRRSIATLYSHLVTRPTGRAIRMGIEAQIAEMGTPCVSVLDFSDVVVLDYSCADETVARLIARFQAADRPGEAVHRGAAGVFAWAHEYHRGFLCFPARGRRVRRPGRRP
jgi:anti-sigma regulatory factor (Ser/Thr protein kinase)